VNLEIPPLRERKSDIPILTKRFVEKNNIRYNKQVWMISDEALQKLHDYDYPGNVRELENIIMAAISLAGDEHVLGPEDININRSYRATSSKVADFSKENTTLTEYLENIEKTVIQQHLVANDGNVSKTAKDLGIVRQNLQHKIKKYKL
jgi:arginine utilization regulatory protein